MKNVLHILIGAGFSKPAGLPLAIDVKNRFDRDIRKQILRQSGGEWMWTEDKDEVTIHNGSIGSDPMCFAYVFNEVIDAYKFERGQFHDYEDFYQFIKEKANDAEWYTPLFQTAQKKMYSDFDISQPNEFYDYNFKYPQFQRIEKIIHHLIPDMLRSKMTDDELLMLYQPFLDYIRKYDEVYIFSLNHDLLLQRLFRIAGIKFCESFSDANSHLRYQEASLPIFQCEFNSAPVKIIQLHGSLINHLFEHGFEEGDTLALDGKYTYYRAINYQSLHYATRIDLTSGKIIQRFSSEGVEPRIVMGTKKRTVIDSDYMYSQLYAMYREKVGTAEELLIIGYSYRDGHINEVLDIFSKNDTASVINLNRGDTFDYPMTNVTEISNFSDLPL